MTSVKHLSLAIKPELVAELNEVRGDGESADAFALEAVRRAVAVRRRDKDFHMRR